ncbi:MAG: DMT family transporter [Rickettsiales bacterium]|jgi:drug/metabolite transporter (DMT)-like permease|nr:DMT family transporter [Rickettsiales bacterium]
MVNHNTSQIIGISWMVLHCLLISIMSAMVRDISSQFHVFEIVFFYNFAAFLFMLPFVFISGRYKDLRTRKFKLHLSRAILGVISLTMYFYAFTVIPLTEARAIALTGPLVSSLFAIIFLKERMGWHRTLALIIGFLGALFILRPGTASFSYVYIMVLSSVGMWAVIDLIIKIMTRTESAYNQVFYLSGLMSVFSLPGAIFYWQTPESYSAWATLFGLGAIFLINIIAIFNAFKYADITAVMPFDFSGMVFTTIIAYLAFNEVIDTPTAIGSLIIVVSSVYIAKREAKQSKEVHAAPPQSEL